MLYTLDLKSPVVAYDLLSNLLRAAEQLESRARHCLQVAQNVQVEVDADSLSTTWSIPGVCCTSARPPAIPSHPAARRSQIAAADRPVDENAICILWWPGTIDIVGVQCN